MSDEALPAEAALRVDAECDRFEAAWQAGQLPRIEDYVADAGGDIRPVLLRELILLDMNYRRRQGERPRPGEYRARFPVDGDLLETLVWEAPPAVPCANPTMTASREAIQETSTAPIESPEGETGLDAGASSMVPKVNGFQFTRCLGKGAFGEVWLATDLALQAERAIKLLPRHCYTQRHTDMLVEEARKMARLPKHRNRVQVHKLLAGVTNCFLVMEYVEGGPLSKLTSPEAPLPWERAVRYVADVADGLAEVHAAGILHRDIKPANILWDRRRDEALLGDFGIAAYAEQARGLAGTPGYIAPELDGGEATVRSDVFSLAATLFCLAAGRPPIDGTDLVASVQQARAGFSRPVAALAGLPRSIEDVILAGLEPNPGRRADLATFTALLRGAHLQALADKLLEASRRSRCKVQLRVSVSVANEGDLTFRPVPSVARDDQSSGDLEQVPEPVPAVEVRTGDLLRFEVTADADGYFTVLNLSSCGELKVLFPNPLARENRVRAGQAHRLTVKLTPPAGSDRAVFIWTRRSSALTPTGWRDRIAAGQMTAVPPQESTRGMDFVLHEATEQQEDPWAASVVTVSHRIS
jgi:serine/threonine protein kinase